MLCKLQILHANKHQKQAQCLSKAVQQSNYLQKHFVCSKTHLVIMNTLKATQMISTKRREDKISISASPLISLSRRSSDNCVSF